MVWWRLCGSLNCIFMLVQFFLNKKNNIPVTQDVSRALFVVAGCYSGGGGHTGSLNSIYTLVQLKIYIKTTYL